MGCGPSSSLPTISALEAHQHAITERNRHGIHFRLSQGDQSAVKIGVFGLRGAGKSSLLHAIRRHLSQPDAPAYVPLPPPTECFEFFSGPVDGSLVTCVDTPGLPCASRAALLPVLASMQRLVFVVDSQADWHFDLAAAEMLDLWREMQAAQPATTGSPPSPQAAQPESSDSPMLVPRKNPQAHTPTLHIVCTKQTTELAPAVAESASSGAASSSSDVSTPVTLPPHEIAAYMGLTSHFTPAQLEHMVHGFNCTWGPSQTDALITAILGPQTQIAPEAIAGAQNPAISVLPTPSPDGQHPQQESGGSDSTPKNEYLNGTAAPAAGSLHQPHPSLTVLPPLPERDPSAAAHPTQAASSPPPLMSPSHVHLVYPFDATTAASLRPRTNGPTLAQQQQARAIRRTTGSNAWESS